MLREANMLITLKEQLISAPFFLKNVLAFCAELSKQGLAIESLLGLCNMLSFVKWEMLLPLPVYLVIQHIFAACFAAEFLQNTGHGQERCCKAIDFSSLMFAQKTGFTRRFGRV